MSAPAQPQTDTPRSGPPYIWITWLCDLLAGTDRCWWKAWYKARYKYVKVEEDAESAARLHSYTVDHDFMVRRRIEKLTKDGFDLRIEDEGAFTLTGQTATLSGKPDVVAMKDGYGLVFDQKSGKRKPGHVWQVLVYMFALPLTWARELTLKGYLEYRDGVVPVRDLTNTDKAAIVAAVRAIGGPEVPARVPSVAECKYCDILSCPDRMKRADAATRLW